MKALVFQRTPQPLDHTVVVPRALNVHVGFNLRIGQHITRTTAGKLAALIRIGDFRGPISGQSLFNASTQNPAFMLLDSR